MMLKSGSESTLFINFRFPYLELSISELQYNEKLALNSLYLANLIEARFNNLDEYVRDF